LELHKTYGEWGLKREVAMTYRVTKHPLSIL